MLAKLTDLDTQGQPADLSRKCLQDLFITDPAIDRAKLITSKGDIVSGTCDWITKKEEFVNWITSDSGLLWISGGPGLGKTMLSIYLTEYLSSYFRPLEDGKSHFSTYFFCDAKDNRRNTSVAIVRGLLFQLLQQKGELFKHILPTYEVQNEQIFQQSSFETIWNIFLRMTNDIKNSQVSCVLDGLDECEPDSLQDLLKKLNKLTSTSPGLKMLILSREYPSCLGASLGQSLRIRLDPDAKTEVSDGLDLYISARVAELSESKKYPAELTDHVKKALRDKSAGTYLWVSFVVKDLETIEVSEVEESLDQLLEGLYPFYERILDQVDPAHRGLTLDVLRWCAFAIEPLTIKELASALKITPTGLLDREAVLRGNITYCGHFLSISNGVLTLVHQSAYDFLTKQMKNSWETRWFSLSDVEVAHSKLTSACIAYMSDVYLDNEGIFEGSCIYDEGKWPQYPFFEYAAKQWPEHFNYAKQQSDDILKKHPQFFADSSILKSWADWSRTSVIGDVLSVAAAAGLPILLQRILKDKSHWLYWKFFFAKHIKELALLTAVERGNLSIVKLLINNGVHVDSTAGLGGTALSWAIMRSQRKVAEFLLSCGADINGKHEFYSPLIEAIKFSKSEFVKLLLEWEHRDCTKPRFKWSPLRKLRNRKHTLDVNSRERKTGNTPLHLAVLCGHNETIRLLLAHPGIDAEPVNRWGFTAMHLALIHCQSNTVQCLMQTRNVPLPELDESWGCSAIHFATFCDIKLSTSWPTRHEVKDKIEILRLLIEELGVDPQFRTAKVSRPDDEWHMHHVEKSGSSEDPLLSLRYRFSYCDREIGHMTLINQHGSCHETALSLCAERNNEKAIDYFLGCCHIDPNACCRGCDGATPLHVAAQSLQVNIVSLLIDSWKVNADAIDRSKRTPLHLVVSVVILPEVINIGRGKEIIKKLIKAGAQHSATDVNGNTPRDLFEARKNISQEKEDELEEMNLKELLAYE